MRKVCRFTLLLNQRLIIGRSKYLDLQANGKGKDDLATKSTAIDTEQIHSHEVLAR